MDPKGQIYFTPPADFKMGLDIATCYIRFDNELLFLKRSPHKTQGSMWGIPGGKVDRETCPLQGMLREVKEETQIDLPIETVIELGTVYCRYPHCDFTYHMFGFRFLKKKPEIALNPEEHSEYAWRSFKEAFSYPLILFEDSCTFLVWNDPFFEGCEKPEIQKSSKLNLRPL